jgi:hypothetical protein
MLVSMLHHEPKIFEVGDRVELIGPEWVSELRGAHGIVSRYEKGEDLYSVVLDLPQPIPRGLQIVKGDEWKTGEVISGRGEEFTLVPPNLCGACGLTFTPCGVVDYLCPDCRKSQVLTP